MYMLIGFRAIQGLGSGAIFIVTYTIIGDVFTLEERPKVQGSIGTVWGIASLVGPFVGGILIDLLSCHWIFFINIPFGILSVVLIQRNLKENFEIKKHKIDFARIFTLSVAMIMFLNIFVASENKSSNNMFTIIIQESVDYNKRGAATAVNTLLRTLGQIIGVSAFVSIFNLNIIKYFTNLGVSGVDSSDLYNSFAYNTIFNSEQIKFSLNNSLHVLFIMFIVISGLALILSIVISKTTENEMDTVQDLEII